jgi:hypothetical protein
VSPLPHTEFRALALKALAARIGSATSAQAFATGAQRAYDDLVRVCAPLIGQAGVDTLTARAVYLAHREHAWLLDGQPAARGRGQRAVPFAPVVSRMSGQDPAVAAQAAAGIFAILLGLLVVLIGRPLTLNLIRKAWPETSSDAHTQEM